MKKIVSFLTALMLVSPGFSQEADFPGRSLLNDPMMIQIPATIIGIYVVATFILGVMRMILDYRIKCKLIEKEVSENLVAQFLQSNKKDYQNLAMKWFSIFIGLGAGLLLISYFPPFGIHSIGIMALSIAAGFLGYFFFTKRTQLE